MTTTLYLDPDSWDLTVDAARCIALASLPYAAAQSVANATRLWRGEAPFAIDRGMPYQEIAGKNPPRQLLANWYETEAVTIPDVANAVAVLEFDRDNRRLTGQIQCTLNDGTVINV